MHPCSANIIAIVLLLYYLSDHLSCSLPPLHLHLIQIAEHLNRSHFKSFANFVPLQLSELRGFPSLFPTFHIICSKTWIFIRIY